VNQNAYGSQKGKSSSGYVTNGVTTRDPVAGLVQIPCIERNAFGASRALDASAFALLSDGRHQVGFDRITQVMRQTGHDLPDIYRETSEGGLAAIDRRSVAPARP
jgi:L-serine deaminase